jgi:hypothetical protein
MLSYMSLYLCRRQHKGWWPTEKVPIYSLGGVPSLLIRMVESYFNGPDTVMVKHIAGANPASRNVFVLPSGFIDYLIGQALQMPRQPDNDLGAVQHSIAEISMRVSVLINSYLCWLRPPSTCLAT